MPQIVDFHDVSTVGLESSPVAAPLAGLRANEARDVVIAARPLQSTAFVAGGIRGVSRIRAPTVHPRA